MVVLWKMSKYRLFERFVGFGDLLSIFTDFQKISRGFRDFFQISRQGVRDFQHTKKAKKVLPILANLFL